MRHHKGHDNNRVLAALAFMDRTGVCEDQLIQFRCIIGYVAALKVHGQFPLIHVHTADESDIPIVDFLVVIVPDLHHLVMNPVLRPSAAQEDPCPVQGVLQSLIQVHGSDQAALHGRQYLDITDRIRMIIAWQILRDILHYQVRRFFRSLLRGEEEIRIPPAADIDRLSFVNPVRIHDNPASLCLAENPLQLYNGNAAGCNDIRKHISGADRWKLIHISHQDQGHIIRNRFQEIVHQHDINHGAFIHNQHIPFQRILFISLVSVWRLDFQQPVNRLCFHAGGLREALCRTSGRRSKNNPGTGFPVCGNDSQCGCRFPGSRAAGQNKHFISYCCQDCLLLDIIVLHACLLPDPLKESLRLNPKAPHSM